MSAFPKPVKLAEPKMQELFSGCLTLSEPVENMTFQPGEMKAITVKSGNFSGPKMKGEVRPTASVVWVTQELAGFRNYDVELVLKTGGLFGINMKVYGKNDKLLCTLFEGNGLKHYRLQHLIAYTSVDEVKGDTVNFTCYEVL